MAFLLSGLRGAVQSELDFFFASLRNQADRISEVSAQAFYKARHQLRADVFTQLNLQFLSAIEADIPTPRWQGLRLVAADASTVRLTQLNKDKVRTIVDAMTFGLFLPSIELCLACPLYPLSCNERQMLFEHLAWLRQDDLLVLDRGYPGAWLAAVLSQTRIPFCIRCDMASTFKVVKEFSRSSLAEAVVTLPAPRRNDAADYECERVVTQVRLIRIITANGRSYIVMTSLIDAQAYPTAAFGDIYHARWCIEEAFKRLKNRLNLEHTSGLSWLAACQNFGVKMVSCEDRYGAPCALRAYSSHVNFGLQPRFRVVCNAEGLPWSGKQRWRRTFSFNRSPWVERFFFWLSQVCTGRARDVENPYSDCQSQFNQSEESMTGLLDIRDAVQQISEAIASVLDIDVIISDADYQIIGDTKKHFKLEVKEIKEKYVIGNVIKTGITQVIREKADSEHCSSCGIQENCNLEAMICVPIPYLGMRIGAIGLIAITQTSREKLLDNQKNLIEFTERMADLIVSKLREKEATTKLTVARNQLISIMDSIDEGIAATDEDGRIIYLNSVLEEILCSKRESLIGKNITDIFTTPYISALVNSGAEFNNIELRISNPDLDVHSLISGRSVILEEKNAGSIIVLKKMEDVYKVINKLTNTSLSTSFEQIIGDSPAMLQLKGTALRVAAGSSSILITGESGTGKELFARAIHHSSPRSKNPFIAINCAAMPEALIESELFGYEEGSFTGASRGGRPGKFQLAHGGTIFLDEIGDMPLHLQPKLLRVIQEKTVEKLGGHKSITVDVRLIAATNKDLEGMADRGEFREDLYYRINVIPLHIPPLRSRPGDIRPLLSFLLKQYNLKLNKKIKGFTANAESTLLSYRWKGNVRELANVVEYAINMEPSSYITTNSLPFKILDKREDCAQIAPVSTLHLAEKELIRSVLEKFGPSVTAKRRAAQALGISLSTLYRKIKEMDIERV